MKELTYEQAISRLEEIVNQLENNEVSLEKAYHYFKKVLSFPNYVIQSSKIYKKSCTDL